MANIPALKLTSKTVEEIRADMIARIPTLTSRWTDFNDADLGVVLLTTLAGMAEALSYELDMRASETTVTHVRQRKNGLRLLKIIGYQHHRKVGARTTLRVTLNAPASKPIPIYPYYFIDSGETPFEVRTSTSPALSFVTETLAIIPVGGQSIDVPAVQGTPQRQVFIGTSDPDQVFTVDSGENAAEGSIRVKVNGTWWERVDHFVDSPADARHYVEDTDENDDINITFGDGLSGAIPDGTIEVIYYSTAGSAGAVFGKGRITNLVTALADFDGGPAPATVSNTEDAGGGEDEEDLFHAKKQAPKEYSKQERAVTKADLIAAVEGFPGVHQATAIDINDVGIESFVLDYFQIKIPIIPTEGNLPTAALKQNLFEYIEEIKAVPDDIEIIDPEYVPIVVSTDIYVYKTYDPSVVTANVQVAIQDFFQIAESPTGELAIGGEVEGRVFGEGVVYSQLIAAIQNVEGVSSVAYLTPSSDITVDAFEMAILASGSPVVNVLGLV